ncbi:hypothetical protein CAPTEDRAFT_137298 [Capitella teleta]|uniref:tRNA N(3)-methylcytidine methyltransferase n=2 Tax=Capitella teleta TaxID=283909 RepID=R7TA91_CAPTE|nr:hypothetical protein CAPTEDRAFT_137298 [Capitella teleta]|eukprot:ELT90658.1 hypothetical protein CAPTEDRAFT_137298 [Capitella teleta]
MASSDEKSWSQHSSASQRLLSEDEQAKLEHQNSRIVSDFKQTKLEREAQKHWDVFYKRNTTKFFKDRHWTSREFEDLCGSEQKGPKTLLEVGCGVGNFLFPLLKDNSSLYIYACDFSPRAVQFVKENSLYDESRCKAFQCDLTSDDLLAYVTPSAVDVVTMIFVLSAIHPDKMLQSLLNIRKVLAPSGCILFRDYGLHDFAMIRFSPGSKLDENFYVRQDGTRSYFFSREKLTELFNEAGFETEKCDYILRETINKKEGVCVPRVFVQGKFTIRKRE